MSGRPRSVPRQGDRPWSDDPFEGRQLGPVADRQDEGAQLADHGRRTGRALVDLDEPLEREPLFIGEESLPAFLDGPGEGVDTADRVPLQLCPERPDQYDGHERSCELGAEVQEDDLGDPASDPRPDRDTEGRSKNDRCREEHQEIRGGALALKAQGPRHLLEKLLVR